MNRLAALALIAAAATPAPLQWPLLSADDPQGKAYSSVLLRGWSKSGALAYVAQTLGDDQAVCPDSDLVWDVSVLAMRSGGSVVTYRLKANGDHGYGEKPIDGEVNAERSKGGCQVPAAGADQYDRSPAGAEAALAALGALTPVCDLSAAGCRSPQGRVLRLLQKAGPADDTCRNKRIWLELDGKTLWQERGQDCARERGIAASVSWSADGHDLAVAWSVEQTMAGYNSSRLYGRLDLFKLP